MRTYLQLGNCNCPWCLNAMMHRLREHSLVRTAILDATMGCLVMDHDCEDREHADHGCPPLSPRLGTGQQRGGRND